MTIPFPILLTVAAALAGLGLWRLLRPARLRVVVSHRAVWEETLRQVGRRRTWRMPRLWMILLAAGGLALAGSVSGMMWSFDRPSPQPVLVLIADTPHLAATVNGRLEKDRLLAKLDELFAKLDPATPVRIEWPPRRYRFDQPFSFEAGEWEDHAGQFASELSMHLWQPDPSDLEHSYRDPKDAMVYLLGEFAVAPPVRPDVQWIFRPQPPADDVGIVAAGAVREGKTGELFVRVRRFAGPRQSVKVVATFAGRFPTSQPADLSKSAEANVVLPIPEGFSEGIKVRLDCQDDQPLNNVFWLAPRSKFDPQLYELIGRTNASIDRALASAKFRPRYPFEPTVDWLIVNEPADPMAAALGQGLVVIAPVQMPGGVKRIGELRDVQIVSRSPEPPWKDLPLDGIKITRADRVELWAGWNAIASDVNGSPLIAYHPADRLIAIFFSVAPENTNWPQLASWPIFWNALQALPGGSRPKETGQGHRIDWVWGPSTTPGLSFRKEHGVDVAMAAGNLPPELFEFAQNDRPVDAEIRKPPARPSQAAFSVWATLAGASLVLLAAGWLLAGRDRREDV